MKYNIIVFFILISALVSCERTKLIDIDFPFEGDKMIVYGIFDENKAIINVFKNENLLVNDTTDFSWKLPLNAILKENKTEVADFHFDKNIGIVNYPFEVNNKYSIEVNSSSFEINSESIKPLTKVEIISTEYLLDADTSVATLTFSFIDTDTLENFYSYSIVQMSEGEIVEMGNWSDFFIDSQFNLSKKTVTTQIENLEKVILDENFQFVEKIKIDEAIIKLYHLSPELYYFKQSLTNSTFNDNLTEQNPLVSNINNGYGYWGCLIIDSVSISLF